MPWVARLVCIALVALPAGQARAVALFFSSSGPGDAPGVVQVDMWFEDPSRAVDLAGLRFDVDIAGGGGLAPGVQLPNTSRSDGTSQRSPFPFDLQQSIGDPDGANDVRTTVVSTDAFSLDDLADLVSRYPACSGAACALQEAGLGHDRLYLGSFNHHYDASPLFLRVSNVFGDDGNNIPDPAPFVLELRQSVTRTPYCNDARGCRIEGLAPELPGPALIGLTLAALGTARWCLSPINPREPAPPRAGARRTRGRGSSCRRGA
jgi:hypothetical protein